MADEKAVSEGSCHAAAMASGIVLLLAVIVAHYHAVAVRDFLVPQYERLDAELVGLVADYPAVVGLLAIVASGAWLVVAFFWRRDSATIIINCCLLLSLVGFLVLHGWVCLLSWPLAPM